MVTSRGIGGDKSFRSGDNPAGLGDNAVGGGDNPVRRSAAVPAAPAPAPTRPAVLPAGQARYDAVLLVSFGGPEGPDDVMPFLANVTAGREIPPERLAAVARQYRHAGGVSPINEQCRRLRGALAERLGAAGHDLPVYWGNRNWTPYLADTVAEMAAAGHRRVLAVTTSAYSSHSGCRQYLDDIAAARAAAGPEAPVIDKLGAYHDRPGFVESFADAVVEARRRLPAAVRSGARLVATAHSIPTAMARGCDYERQLRATAQLVADAAGFEDWHLAWQSRSGPPSVPWLEPDVNDLLAVLAGPNGGASDRGGEPVRAVVLAPIGFVTDHTEVVWDLDVTAAATADRLGISMTRAVTPGTGPDERFTAMWQELIEERLHGPSVRRSVGDLGASPDVCPPGCCPRR